MILFINKEYLDSKSLISPNMDWNIIKPVVELVQFKRIKPLLGTDLYDAISAKVQAFLSSGTAITASYKLLLDDYIRPCMLWHIQAELAIPTKFRFDPTGILESTPEGRQVISSQDLDMLIDEYRNNGEAYGEELVRYLKEYNSTYPEYSTNSGHKTQPQSSAYNAPFYIPKRGQVKPYNNWNE